MKKITLITLFLIGCLVCHCLYSFGQVNRKQGYCSFSAAYVPSGGNAGYIGLQLTAGRDIGSTFLEYSQTITLSPEVDAAKLFQVRGGYSFDLDKCLEIRPFVAYGLSSVPKDESKRVSHSGCIGAALVQNVDHSDLSIKYELSLNNNFLIVPSIGALVRF